MEPQVPAVPALDDAATKEWWKSKGAVGSIIAVLAIVFGSVGYAITPDLQGEVVDAWSKVIALGGALFGLIGRITATKRVAS